MEFVFALLLKLILPAAGSLACAGAAAAGNALRKKWGAQAGDMVQGLLERAAADAIAYAEEWAASLKDKDKPSGREKEAAAVEHVLSVVPGVTEARARAAVKAALARTVGAGATKDRVVIPREASVLLAAEMAP